MRASSYKDLLSGNANRTNDGLEMTHSVTVRIVMLTDTKENQATFIFTELFVDFIFGSC